MNIAIIGCGGIARAHAQCVQMRDEDELIAVEDIDPAAARGFAAEFGGSAFESVAKLLADAPPDAAIVCTPPNTHKALVTQILEAGVAVLCEKPLAHTVSDAEALAEVAAKTGLPAYVAYCHRFNPAAQYMRDCVRAGELGTVQYFRNAFLGSAPQLTTAWRTDVEVSGGGCLMDNGSHSIDILQFVTGEVMDVRANLHFADEGRGDVAAELMTLGKEGVTGLISVSYVSAKGEAMFELVGSEMSLLYDYATSGSSVTVFRPNEEPAKQALSGGCDVRFVEQYRAFREALQGRPTPLATFDDGLSVSRVIDQCQRQAGVPGTLPS